MTSSEIAEIARELIRNRIYENGYPFDEFDTAETVALEMVEQCDPFAGAGHDDIVSGVHSALKAEGFDLPPRQPE